MVLVVIVVIAAVLLVRIVGICVIVATANRLARGEMSFKHKKNVRFIIVSLSLLATGVVGLAWVVAIVLLIILIVRVGIPAWLAALLTAVTIIVILMGRSLALRLALTLTLRVSRHVGRLVWNCRVSAIPRFARETISAAAGGSGSSRHEVNHKLTKSNVHGFLGVEQPSIAAQIEIRTRLQKRCRD
jgi:hypothetical protein